MLSRLPIDNNHKPLGLRKPFRLCITLPYSVQQPLFDRAFKEGRSLSTLCAFLIENSLRES